MRINKSAVVGLASVALAASGVAGTALTREDSASAANGSGLRFNQVQMIGSHNSYHRELSPAEQKVQQAQNPGSVDLWYSHAPITQQLEDQNVRTLELDLLPDPAGGLYTYPLIRKLTGQEPLTDPAMARPGIKVMHVPDFDYNTTCDTFVLCLQQVRSWSEQHPNHVPITINLELKQSDPKVVAAGGVQSPPWDATNLEGVDQEIRSVFSEKELLTPDDVRKPGLTLEQSVLTKGWPTLDEARGQVLFYFDNGGPGAIRDLYRTGHQNLEGRAVFTQGPEGEPDAAITQVNDPRGANQAEIQRLVSKGYLIRTRSDEPMATIRDKDYTRLGIALASGAQVVTTDWPVAGMAARYDSDFVAKLPGHTAVRCNPVTAPKWCHGDVVGR
ncbi:calcium-dependent phosphoinositide phospholipase C [Kribbella sp. VKM Ac-2571]|uniref:phosphatidylinositol-specific phospholipase C1-like protein n=1 Tax=Kribbella sp. VKM Ac-2571 TaxID=2512222 RepID=UPI001060FEDA|nr:phosphatidylinositol-specific phospholipase C1-like protein [Kribbella sp. VKM Ac-2571]TDO58006.1 calcium-dependent phosphoinositide phospholipase C [Kribbella sp. VKM Ac-2571]